MEPGRPWAGSAGSFKDVAAPDLGATAIKAALERANISPDMVEEVVMGNALQAAEAGYAARLSSLNAGIPEETPTIAVNRQCSSGLEAINMAAMLVRSGEVDIAVAGGTENMSQAPFMLEYHVRFDGLRMGDGNLRDGLIEGLGCPVNRYHMGVTAENVAERFGVSRGGPGRTRAHQPPASSVRHRRRTVRRPDNARLRPPAAR